MVLTSQTPNAPWLRTTPPDWLADRLKDIVPRILGGGTPPSSDPDCWEDGDIVWVTPTDFSRAENSSEISDSERKITRMGLNSSAATLLPQGTVIMASRATIGTVRLAGTELTTNQGFISFVCDERKLHRRFLYYVISGFLGEYFAEIAPGTTFQEISRGKAKLEPIGYPPPPEQQRIAAYLDASCAAIDAAVAAKRRQLETLDALRKETVTRAITRGLKPSTRTKPSGEDWLGEIPTHWSAPCLKRLLREPLTYGLNEAAELEERDLPRYLRITDFDDDGNLRDDTFRSLPRDIAREALLEPNDVLFARSGATVGKTFMFRNYDGEACFAGYLIRARTLLWKLEPLFLYLFTKSTAYESWKNLIFTRATIQNISAAKYNYLAIPLPPLNEQRAIVAHVEEKSAEFRTLTACIESQIATLTAYRKSLIHECVTGQRLISKADVVRSQLSENTGQLNTEDLL